MCGLVGRVAGVQSLGYLRARWMGDQIWVDLSVRVAPGKTVTECDQIAQLVRDALFGGIDGMSNVQVEFDTSGEPIT